MSVTLNIKKVIETFKQDVHVAIPPENPVIEGYITVHYRVKSKDEVAELNARNLTDEDYFKIIVDRIDGMGGDDGNPLAGDAAIEEALHGKYSMYLVPAIVRKYWSQYNEALQGNSPKRR